MLTVSLNNLGKKFNREWIFRNLSFEIGSQDKVVILGGNGSGKSTLLQVISGFVTPNEGNLTYAFEGTKTDPDAMRKLVSFASPYLQLIEDFTMEELLLHAASFRKFKNNLQPGEIIEILQLTAARNKFIRQFSSGMKQRLKLGLAILADTPLLLLDEPVSNLDRAAINWYGKLIADHTAHRAVVVCSNAIAEEYSFCTRELNMMDFKPKAK